MLKRSGLPMVVGGRPAGTDAPRAGLDGCVLAPMARIPVSVDHSPDAAVSVGPCHADRRRTENTALETLRGVTSSARNWLEFVCSRRIFLSPTGARLTPSWGPDDDPVHPRRAPQRSPRRGDDTAHY